MVIGLGGMNSSKNQFYQKRQSKKKKHNKPEKPGIDKKKSNNRED